jgi:hypothetical protein
VGDAYVADGADDLDADAIYRQIGVYVVSFQHLENQLFQICWFLSEPCYSESGRRELAEKPYGWLVGETGRRVYDFLCSQNRENSEFAEGFHTHLSQCHAIGKERNRIVHSAYIHLEAGGKLHGIVRSDMRKDSQGPDVDFDQEYLTEQAFADELRQIAEVAIALSVDFRQLIFWRR